MEPVALPIILVVSPVSHELAPDHNHQLLLLLAQISVQVDNLLDDSLPIPSEPSQPTLGLVMDLL